MTNRLITFILSITMAFTSVAQTVTKIEPAITVPSKGQLVELGSTDEHLFLFAKEEVTQMGKNRFEYNWYRLDRGNSQLEKHGITIDPLLLLTDASLVFGEGEIALFGAKRKGMNAEYYMQRYSDQGVFMDEKPVYSLSISEQMDLVKPHRFGALSKSMVSPNLTFGLYISEFHTVISGSDVTKAIVDNHPGESNIAWQINNKGEAVLVRRTSSGYKLVSLDAAGKKSEKSLTGLTMAKHFFVSKDNNGDFYVSVLSGPNGASAEFANSKWLSKNAGEVTDIKLMAVRFPLATEILATVKVPEVNKEWLYYEGFVDLGDELCVTFQSNHIEDNGNSLSTHSDNILVLGFNKAEKKASVASIEKICRFSVSDPYDAIRVSKVGSEIQLLYFTSPKMHFNDFSFVKTTLTEQFQIKDQTVLDLGAKNLVPFRNEEGINSTSVIAFKKDYNDLILHKIELN